ncbi:MAG: ferredoxin, partial [Gemmatimonadota bacterium]|nr:ferredoxin [Gemmatimonadota bacterium]
EERGEVPHMPVLMEAAHAEAGPGHEGRFWEQVCALCKLGQDGIADPFAAISAIPAVTSSIRDMSGVRLEVPEFIGEKCTGCAQCWVQCPDSAIPGLVNSTEEIIDAAIRTSSNGTQFERVRPIVKHWARETQKRLEKDATLTVADAFAGAYDAVAGKMAWDADRRAATDREQVILQQRLAEFPLARTRPFFDAPEAKQKGTGGLLSVTINPETCKGCNLCVEVCPDGALITVKQDATNLALLQRNWEMWNRLPDTDDRFINVSDVDEGIGILSSLLLKKETYRSMVGGDGACMGCGEKTTVHLIVSAIHAQMAPRIKAHVEELDALIGVLDGKARELLASGADLNAAAASRDTVSVPLAEAKRKDLARLNDTLRELKDLKWRYVEGPSGKGRASLGMANSTGCSSVWGSTYPYNPYPFPWVNHLFQDSPSIAIGVFDAHMRKMADGFVVMRRARALADGTYDAARLEPELATLEWHQFTDDEFFLCPPIVSMGGDGAMLDIGFQNLSRLLASGKPVRVVVLDTQVYSNTGGQACTSGYTGQVADMSAFGKAQSGKTEVRKELGLLAIAHRGVFVHQSSQAASSHLLAGVLKGLRKRRPAIFNIYTPCPVEHGLADDWSQHAARLSLESRAFPFLTYDPDGGSAFADCLSLEGNPSLDTDWPEYSLKYVDEEGAEQTMELPLTIADWAATEARFKQHFGEIARDKWDDDLVPFHEYIALPAEDREGKTAFIHGVTPDRKLRRLRVGPAIAELARERLEFWSQLRQLAGVQVSDSVRDLVSRDLDAEYERREAGLRAELEAQLAELRTNYPRQIAKRLVEGLMKQGGGAAIADLLATLPAAPAGARTGNGSAPAVTEPAPPAAVAAPASAPVAAAPAAPAAPAKAPAAAPDDDGPLSIEPYIDTVQCTTCNECTNLNGRMFAYNDAKQAYIKDPKAGTFQQLVLAAERCPVSIIHPGTPLNPKEKDLPKWIKRAEKFN